MNPKNYEEYLKSNHWQRLSEEAKRLAGYRCQVCNSEEELRTHHRTYERKGDEFQGDLTVLCNSCHRLFHKKENALRLIDLEIDALYLEQFAELKSEYEKLRRLLRAVTGTLMSFGKDTFNPKMYERLNKLLGIDKQMK